MDHYGLTLVSGPAGEPVTVEEAKGYARVDHDLEGDSWQAWVEEYRQDCERVTGRQLLAATWRLTLDRWPCDGVIRPPRPPLSSVVSVKYLDTAGVEQTIDPADYDVDAASEPGRITAAYGVSWPTARCVPGAIRVTFAAGYGEASDVPSAFRSRILQAVAYRNERRTEADKAFTDSLFAGLWCGSY